MSSSPTDRSNSLQGSERLIRPDALKKAEGLVWSTGSGMDVWDLFCSAMTGDLDTARKLVSKDPSLVRARYEYRSAISFAVRENQVEVAEFLLSQGANPVDSGCNDTLLQLARDRGFKDLAILLEKAIAGPEGKVEDGMTMASVIKARDEDELKKWLSASPSLVHARDERTNQPIHWAVMTRQPRMVDELLRYGADINAQRVDGARPIQLCNGDYHYRGWRDVPAETVFSAADMLRHLRQSGAHCDICTASFAGDLARVKELLAEDPGLANQPSDYITYYACSGTPLRNAAEGGHMAIVKLLLDRGADPNLPEEGIAPRGHALHVAVCKGYSDIVRLLLDRGAYPNVEIESSADTLCAAIARKNKELIELLCSRGAARRVHLLAYYGELQEAAAVFAANPSLADDTEALEYAVAEGHPSFARLMLHYRPGLARRISTGVNRGTALDPQAARELVEWLFRNGMDPNLSNWLRISPLHQFAGKDDLDNAMLFVDHGARLDVLDEEYHSTPLGYAARNGRIRMAEFLLEKGADPGLPEEYPWARPISWATRRSDPAMIQLLQHYGAKA